MRLRCTEPARDFNDMELVAWFDHMAARGEGTEPTPTFSGVSHPFTLATGGRATLRTRLRR